MTPRTEQELLDATIDLATRCQWRVFHPRPARLVDGSWRTATQGHNGWPDLALARAGVLLLRELKGYDSRERLGKLSDDQIAWGAAISPNEVPAERFTDPAARRLHRMRLLFDVWTPDDWDLIVATLTARSPQSVAEPVSRVGGHGG